MNDPTQQAMTAMYGGSPSGMGGDQMEGNMSRAPKSPFVDAVDGDVARLIMPDGSTKEVPVNQLPPGTKEGQFLGDKNGDESAFYDQDTTLRRQKLLQGDNGGDITL